jgi:hypothetical protein
MLRSLNDHLNIPDKVPEIGSESHVSVQHVSIRRQVHVTFSAIKAESNLRSRRLFQSPFLHRNTLEQNESLAIENLPPDRAKELFKLGQREQILSTHTNQRM